jgi:hypothetical protein
MNNIPQTVTIPLSKSRTMFMAVLWLVLALGALYLAVKSIDPLYWQTIHINVEGTTWLMRQLPVAARVGILGLIGLALLMLFAVTVQRLLSDAPALIMDADGLEGFKSGISRGTVRLRWDEIGDITTHYGQMFIYSKRESMFAKRKLITLSTDTVGKSGKDIVATMQAFMLTTRLSSLAAPQQSQLPQQSYAPQRSFETTLPSSPSMAMPRPPVMQPQVVIRTSPTMADAGKPSFGTRRS